MSNEDRKQPKEDIHPVIDPPQPPDQDDNNLEEPARAADQNPHRQPARPDPRTGEIPAGPGDAGLQDRPALNDGTPGTRQMSNNRLGMIIGVALLLAIVTAIVALLF